MRCATCGRTDGHDYLTHRNQKLVEWWPLWRVSPGKGRIVQANRAEDVPRVMVKWASEETRKLIETT